MAKLSKTIGTTIVLLIGVMMLYRVCFYPELYSTTMRKSLVEGVRKGNPSAVTYYETQYVSKGIEFDELVNYQGK